MAPVYSIVISPVYLYIAPVYRILKFILEPDGEKQWVLRPVKKGFSPICFYRLNSPMFHHFFCRLNSPTVYQYFSIAQIHPLFTNYSPCCSYYRPSINICNIAVSWYLQIITLLEMKCAAKFGFLIHGSVIWRITPYTTSTRNKLTFIFTCAFLNNKSLQHIHIV